MENRNVYKGYNNVITMRNELIKPIIRVGNGAGVLLPKEWLNGQAKIELVDKPSNIKKDIFEILDPWLPNIFGIYLTGSYARGEHIGSSDIDIVVISESIRKEIISGKYHISIIPLKNIKKMITKKPILIFPRIIEAKALLNETLLHELKIIKIEKRKFDEFIEDTKDLINIDREVIILDKEESKELKSLSVLYSLILRLRGLFIVKAILERKRYSTRGFKAWLKRNLKDLDVEKIYKAYVNFRNDKRVNEKISIEEAEKIISFLEKEVEKW